MWKYFDTIGSLGDNQMVLFKDNTVMIYNLITNLTKKIQIGEDIKLPYPFNEGKISGMVFNKNTGIIYWFKHNMCLKFQIEDFKNLIYLNIPNKINPVLNEINLEFRGLPLFIQQGKFNCVYSPDLDRSSILHWIYDNNKVIIYDLTKNIISPTTTPGLYGNIKNNKSAVIEKTTLFKLYPNLNGLITDQRLPLHGIININTNINIEDKDNDRLLMIKYDHYAIYNIKTQETIEMDYIIPKLSGLCQPFIQSHQLLLIDKKKYLSNNDLKLKIKINNFKISQINSKLKNIKDMLNFKQYYDNPDLLVTWLHDQELDIEQQIKIISLYNKSNKCNLVK